MADFQIQVERLTETPLRFEFEATADWWANRGSVNREESCEIEQPFRFELVASRNQDNVRIEGDVTGRVVLECSRCAKRYPHALRDTFRLFLNPAKGHAPPDPEGEQGLAQYGVCLGEDLEEGLYRGPVVGLDDFFGEVITLAMPLQPLCDEGCLGICAHCGLEKSGLEKSGLEKSGVEKSRPNERDADTPTGSGAVCSCEDEKIGSPFAVLASLKGNLGGGNDA